MAWGNEWPTKAEIEAKWPSGKDVAERQSNQGAVDWSSQKAVNEQLLEDAQKMLSHNDKPVEWPKPTDGSEIKFVGIDLAEPETDKTVTVLWVDDKIEKVYNNKVPTHDPYTNPDAQIYYQCGCGAILDPGTKSFAALNNAAMNSGWKIRWGATSYVPYCVKCGENVE